MLGHAQWMEDKSVLKKIGLNISGTRNLCSKEINFVK